MSAIGPWEPSTDCGGPQSPSTATGDPCKGRMLNMSKINQQIQTNLSIFFMLYLGSSHLYRSDPCCSVPLIPGCISGHRGAFCSPWGHIPRGSEGLPRPFHRTLVLSPARPPEFFLLPLPGPDPSLPHKGGLILAGTFLAVCLGPLTPHLSGAAVPSPVKQASENPYPPPPRRL